MMHNPVPAPPADVKTCDTTGDQIGRLLLRMINLLWTILLLAGALPLGLIWFVGSIIMIIWNTSRRAKRYARNAAALADYQVAMMHHRAGEWRARYYDVNEGRFQGDRLPPYPPPGPSSPPTP